MSFRRLRILSAGLLCATAFHPVSLFACAACYGASDSPMAKGMNWGILSLLGVVVMVLGGVATFFVFIGKRSMAASNEPETAPAEQSKPTEKA